MKVEATANVSGLSERRRRFAVDMMGGLLFRVLFALLSAITLVPAVHAQPYTFSHLAGSPGGIGFEDGTGSAARFGFPAAVAVDTAGNIYVADFNNNTIRKITSGGVVTTLAGLAGTAGSTNGTGGTARFNGPFGVAVDGSGNVYVAELLAHTIRKISSGGVVTTLAGLAGSSGTVDGTGSAARFSGPAGVAVDSVGNVYVTDRDSSTIRKITAAGVVTTLAGLANVQGSADGTGSAARFNQPNGLTVDSAGNVYVADSINFTIRKITSVGVVTTLAGSVGQRGSTDGTGSAARFSTPVDVAVDGAGNIYVADFRNELIRKVTSAGVVTTLAGLAGTPGSVDGTGSAARFRVPFGVAVDGAGNVFVADGDNNTIRQVTGAGVVTTLAGLAGTPGSNDGTGSAAGFNNNRGVAVDSAGNVYVADTLNHAIRKVTSGGVVTTLAGLPGVSGSADGTGTVARFNSPSGVAVDLGGNVYVGDSGNNTIRRVTIAGIVTTLAGMAGTSGSVDATGIAARFSLPTGVAVDSAGNVLVADTGNNAIRRVTPAGVVTTLAGLAGSPGNSDGTGSTARFRAPSGVAVDAAFNVFVADRDNNTIRRVTSGGVVTTFAGLAGAFGVGDGTGSAARFGGPSGVAIDGNGNLYVADRFNHSIRRITSAGVVTTLGGRPGTAGSSDGTGTVARFNEPHGVAVDGTGTVFVADTFNHAIRIGRPALADVATIDAAMGPVGTNRQLGTAPSTATSFEWTLVRRPAGSTAVLSSTSIPNPTFRPDVADLYIFRLTASSATGSSITLVSFTATPGPAAVKGDADGNGIVSVADIFYLINNLFAGGPAPVGSGDADGNGGVSVADIFYLINFLFAGGPAPL